MVLRPHSPVALVCGLLNVCAAFVPGTTGGMGLMPIAASAPCRPAASTTGSGGHPGHRRHLAVTMASSVAPAPRTKAEKTSELFKLKDGGMVEFGSGQRVEVRVQERVRRARSHGVILYGAVFVVNKLQRLSRYVCVLLQTREEIQQRRRSGQGR